MQKTEKLTKEEFYSLKPLNNMVFIERPEKDLGYTIRPSGLLIMTNTETMITNSHESYEAINVADSLPRWGYVSKIPEKLEFNERQFKNKKDNSQSWKMDWETKIEIKEGDKVWADYYSLNNCDMIECEGKEYWVVDYSNLIVSKREDEVIMLNGNVLFEQINEGLTSKFLELPENINKSKGVVRYVGSKNIRYVNKTRFDDIDVNTGDLVLFRNKVETLLEAKAHYKFEEKAFRYSQRPEIYAVLN
jgi:co-chaperonin GroES (HSP10)